MRTMIAVPIVLVVLGLACGGQTAGVTVTDSSPGPSAWQLSYENGWAQPMSCTANLIFSNENPGLLEYYGWEERSFTLEPGETVTIIFPEPTTGPIASGGVGYVVFYRPGQGEADGLFLSCDPLE